MKNELADCCLEHLLAPVLPFAIAMANVVLLGQRP
jgi:hypothetical protein